MAGEIASTVLSRIAVLVPLDAGKLFPKDYALQTLGRYIGNHELALLAQALNA
jgi:hypothetical protein